MFELKKKEKNPDCIEEMHPPRMVLQALAEISVHSELPSNSTSLRASGMGKDGRAQVRLHKLQAALVPSATSDTNEIKKLQVRVGIIPTRETRICQPGKEGTAAARAGVAGTGTASETQPLTASQRTPGNNQSQ